MSDTTERMQDAARAIQAHLPPGCGFVLMAFDFGTAGRLEYVSNADRSDVVKVLREAADNFTAEAFGKHVGHGVYEIDRRIFDLNLFAWLGEDELGSGTIGIKQAIVPAGCIPIVANDKNKIAGGSIRTQIWRCRRDVIERRSAWCGFVSSASRTR